MESILSDSKVNEGNGSQSVKRKHCICLLQEADILPIN